jgi:hypothetical protein
MDERMERVLAWLAYWTGGIHDTKRLFLVVIVVMVLGWDLGLGAWMGIGASLLATSMA